jgi:hypothetical protein
MSLVLSRELKAIARDLPNLSGEQLDDLAEIIGQLASLAVALESELQAHRLLERGQRTRQLAAEAVAGALTAVATSTDNVIRPVFRRTTEDDAC